MKLANWLSEILEKLFACEDIWLTALSTLLAMINKEKHAVSHACVRTPHKVSI